VSEVNVRAHRAGRKGWDTGFVPVPTAESDLVGQTIYVSSIYIANTSAGVVIVTLKEKGTGRVIFNRSLAAGEVVNLFFSEPIRFDGGIRHSASTTGAIIHVAGYL
jgi:hypothetical protein